MPFLPRRLLASWSMSSFCVAPSRVSRRGRMMNEARPSFAILYHGNVGIRFLSTLYGNQLCLVLHCRFPSQVIQLVSRTTIFTVARRFV